MIVGIGDSNWEFEGHGFAKGFSRFIDQKTLVYYPGGSSEDVVQRLSGKTLTTEDVPVGATVVVNLGINDRTQELSACETVKNHLKIKEIVERQVGEREWVWMSSHYTGSWGLEMVRLALCLSSKFNGIKFVNLRKYKSGTIYNAPYDKLHLTEDSYKYLSFEALRDIL